MLRTLWPHRHLIAHLAWRRLRNRYRRTVFGLAWAMLNPLSLALVLAAVYSNILGRDFETYALYLLCGLFPWTFIGEVSTHACSAYPQSRDFLRQVAVPTAVYPTIVYLANGIGFLFAFGALLLVLLFFDALRPLGVLAALPGLLILLGFGWGFAMTQAVFGAVFRDYEYISGVALRLLFFATPILYRAEMMERAGRAWLYAYNPFHYLLDNVRGPLLTGELPDVRSLAVAAAFAVFVGVVGWTLVRVVGRRIVHFL